jgi:hypothetical protein
VHCALHTLTRRFTVFRHRRCSKSYLPEGYHARRGQCCRRRPPQSVTRTETRGNALRVAQRA